MSTTIKAVTPKKNGAKRQPKKSAKKAANRAARQRQIPFKLQAPVENKAQLRADPRANSDGQRPCIELENQIKSLVAPVLVQNENMEDFCRGIVMKALEKGVQPFVEDPRQPYWAYVYMVKIMRGLIVNDAQVVANVPYSLLAMCRALKSKDVRFANGMVSYQAYANSFIQPTPTKVIGFAPYGYTWCVGVPTSVNVNVRFPTLNNVIPGYTDELGATAYNRLCQLLIDDKKKENAFRMVGIQTPTVMDKDVSAFAITPKTQRSVGLGTQGAAGSGISVTSGLEVPIRRPQFCAFNSSTFEPSIIQRMENLHAQTCGDATFLGAGMGSWFDESKWNMQRPPKLHPVHLNDFVDVIGKWVSGMQQNFVNDPENVDVSTSQIQCSLTLQETAILVRNVLMTAFKNTQASVHAMYPVVPDSSDDDQFVPLIVSSNTCFLTNTDMSLPRILIENIRSLVGRFVHRSGDDYEFFLPILGQKSEWQYDETAYTFTPTGESPVLSFRPASEIGKRKMVGKGGEYFAPLAEIPIDMIDGSYSGGFACINDPNALKQLLKLWEDWLKNSGLSTYSAPLGHLGTEDGVNVLCSINMTRIIGTVQIDSGSGLPKYDGYNTIKKNHHLDTLRGDGDVVDTRFLDGRKTRKVNEVLAEEIAVLDTSQSVLLSVAYEEFQSNWILPRFTQTINLNTNVSATRWQGLASEPYAAILTNGQDGVDLDTLYASYAAKLVRSKLQPPTVWDEQFATLEASGRGGILTSLVSGFANALIPGAGKVVSDIGNAIGI